MDRGERDVTTTLPPIPDGLRARAERLGADGVRWFEQLPELLTEAATHWRLELGYGLDVPLDALVVRGRNSQGPVTLKLCAPGYPFERETAVLDAARGRGYVRLLHSDAGRRALLLEAVGPELDAVELERRIGAHGVRSVLAKTLAAAWTVPPATLPATEPQDHPAARLREIVAAHPCPDDIADGHRAIERALAYAERLVELGDTTEVVAHGNPSPAHFQRVQSGRPGAETGYVLVAPLGLRTAPEYDLGVLLRDTNRPLLAAEDPVVLARQWCAQLAGETGCDAELIWQWSYLQRVAHGLEAAQGSSALLGRTYLQTAVGLVSRRRG